ncbi:MAG: hypothetical protein WAU53_12190 [Rhodoplanes sp.]
MPQFDPEQIQIIKSALEEVMTRVPPDCSTITVKAYLAEHILKAAAHGQTTFDMLVSAGTDQIQAILSLFT